MPTVNIKGFSHKKSSVIENGLPKLPTAAQLELGELAINFADGYETLSIKNSNNEIVTFTNDQYWKDKEQVIASALNDLNSRILAITVPTNVSDLVNDVPYLTASDLDDTPTEDSDNGITSGGVYDYITEIEEATSAALNDLNSRIDDMVIPVVPPTSTTVTEDDPNPVSGGAVYDVVVENERITSAALNDLNERIPKIITFNITSTTQNGVTTYDWGTTTFSDIEDAIENYDIVRISINNNQVILNHGTTISDNGNAYVFYGTFRFFQTGVITAILNEGSNNSIEMSLDIYVLRQPDWSESDTTSSAFIQNKPINIVTGDSTAYTIWCGTQAEYNALQTYDNNTVYLIKETV